LFASEGLVPAGLVTRRFERQTQRGRFDRPNREGVTMYVVEPLPCPTEGAWHHERVRSPQDMGRLLGTIASAMSESGYQARDIFAVRLALEEAIVNAVEHGHRGDGLKSVRVTYQVEPGQVLAEVEDQGPGFDPSQVPDPTAPENLAKPSGRGLFLMRHLMSWVRHNVRGNRVTLCRYRPHDSSGPTGPRQ
jgi:serine/threonine-protein kinase RsbW